MLTKAPVLPIVIPSIAERGSHKPGYAYRGYKYVKAQTSIGSPANEQSAIYIDSRYLISLIDPKFFIKYSLIIGTSTIPIAINVKNISKAFNNVIKFIKVDFYFLTINSSYAYFYREIYIVDNFKTNALIRSNILYFKS